MSKTIGEQVNSGIPDWLLKGIGFDKTLGRPLEITVRASRRTAIQVSVHYVSSQTKEIKTKFYTYKTR